jgi:rod shape-determining protein MreC
MTVTPDGELRTANAMSRIARQIAVIATLIALVIIVARSGLLGSSLQSLTMDVVAPCVDVLAYPFRTLAAGWEPVARGRTLVQENQALRGSLAELERKYQQAREYEPRCRELEQLVNLSAQLEAEVVAARVVLRDEFEWSRTIVIDRGRRDGLVPNMAVLSGAGLVGKVIQAGYAYARVLLITDRSFRCAARLRQSRTTGVAEGRGTDQIVLTYLPREAGAVTGEEVITSGQGGVFPAGLLVGTVQRTYFEEYGFYQYATLRPIVDFATLETVAVVKRLPAQIDVPPSLTE